MLAVLRGCSSVASVALVNQKDEAVMLPCLCRPTSSFRTSCCVAVGTDGHGVALLTLTFIQHGPNVVVSSQAVQHIPHTAPALRICASWDHLAPVCDFPCPLMPQRAATRQTLERNAADVQAGLAVGLPPIAPNASVTQTEAFRQSTLNLIQSGPEITQQQLQQQQQQSEDVTKEGSSRYAHDACGSLAGSSSAAAAARAVSVQQHSDALAAACDRTHLFIVWGLTPFTQPEAPDSTTAIANDCVRLSNADIGRPQLSNSAAAGAAAGDAATAVDAAGGACAGAGAAIGAAATTAADDSAGAVNNSEPSKGGFRDKISANDLVARLRRLRPQLHATGPCSPKSATAAANPVRLPQSSETRYFVSVFVLLSVIALFI